MEESRRPRAPIRAAISTAQRQAIGIDRTDNARGASDQGEIVTLPSLAEPALWDTFEAARVALAPGLSRREAASRYMRR